MAQASIGPLAIVMSTTHNPPNLVITTGTPDRSRIYQLAARAHVDPRTAARALREGVDAIRTHRDREAIRQAIEEIDAE